MRLLIAALLVPVSGCDAPSFCWVGSAQASSPAEPRIAPRIRPPAPPPTLPPEAAVCALSECPRRELGVPLAPCCTDDSPTLCGLNGQPLASAFGLDRELSRCVPLDVPGVVTEACPSLRVDTLQLNGCCRVRDGICGYLTDFSRSIDRLGIGCAHPGLLAEGPALQFCNPP